MQVKTDCENLYPKPKFWLKIVFKILETGQVGFLAVVASACWPVLIFFFLMMKEEKKRPNLSASSFCFLSISFCLSSSFFFQELTASSSSLSSPSSLHWRKNKHYADWWTDKAYASWNKQPQAFQAINKSGKMQLYRNGKWLFFTICHNTTWVTCLGKMIIHLW